ncbi:MAG: hypothetical protein IPO07_19970 [Haliscomenobacter sp.]|nr:hypothetical protein [Haliscomenobacter sp.]MBK9490802.1 hypothetical protein [Haliscomenobacter sp.]
MYSTFNGTSPGTPEPLSFQQAGINTDNRLSGNGKTLYYTTSPRWLGRTTFG